MVQTCMMTCCEQWIMGRASIVRRCQGGWGRICCDTLRPPPFPEGLFEARQCGLLQ